MFLRRKSWAQLTRLGVPALSVLRPLAGYTPPNIGDPYPTPDPADKHQLMRTRQMYEQRRIGIEEEATIAALKQPKSPVQPEGEKEKTWQNKSSKRR